MAANLRDGVSDDFDYEHWSPIAETRLVENGVWDVVQNGVSPNPTTDPEVAATIKVEDLTQWRNRMIEDNKALKIMQSALPDSVFRKTISVASSKELWDLLKKGNDNEEAKKLRRLEKQLENLTMYEGERMKSYLKRVEKIIEEFFVWGNPISDEKVIAKLLTSLPRPYDDSITVLKEFMTLPDLTHRDLLKAFEMFGSNPKTMPQELMKFINILRKAHSDRLPCRGYDKNNPIKDAKLLRLEKQFEKLMMYDGESMDSYLERVLDTIEQFRASGNPLSDDDVIAKLLTSLSWPYDDAIPVLEELMNLPDMTPHDLIGVLEMFGSHPEIMPQGLKDFVKSLRKAKAEQLWCGVCKMYNHYQEDCYYNPRVVNLGGGERGHCARDCCNTRNLQPGATLQAQKREVNDDFTYDEDMWMLYTTTENHMTPYEKFFTSLDRTYRAGVQLAGVNVVMVEGIGDVKFTMKGVKMTIKDVLFVPRINKNVLSFSRMKKRGYSLEMEGGECTIRDEKGKIFVQTLREKRGIALRLQVTERYLL
ncbi:unnamed protein product [Arabidopsis thaliana]|uniref:Retrovirus-related Pol polyprotein from transposon TNT 1-94-like beta-barrel domain-containing protein n=1 Tax=Arabidopsis thaliana TaxID=3702 RepID=Q9LJC9_ARATH|nr:unnamed protein product [Arabidopsis thaliana]